MFFDNPKLLRLLVIPALLVLFFIFRFFVFRRSDLMVSGIGPLLAGGPCVLVLL